MASNDDINRPVTMRARALLNLDSNLLLLFAVVADKDGAKRRLGIPKMYSCKKTTTADRAKLKPSNRVKHDKGDDDKTTPGP